MPTDEMPVESQTSERSTNDLATIHLGIVCPMANERATAESFVTSVLRECEAHDFASVTLFVVLDRKSTDGTRELLEAFQECNPMLRVVWAPENRCVVDAYVRGYREAIAAGCDWILEIDGGYSHQPEDLPAFFRKMAEGYDCVFGSRFCDGGKVSDTALKRRVISQGGTFLANLLLGTRLRDMTSGYGFSVAGHCSACSRAAFSHAGIFSRPRSRRTAETLQWRKFRSTTARRATA